MKKLVCAVFAMCLIAADSPEVQVANAEKAVDDALRNKDAAAADRLLADEYIHIYPNVVVASKKQALDALAASRIPSYAWVGKPRIWVYGNIAVVSGRRHASEPNVSDVMMISVWLKRGDEWRRVSVQTAPPSEAAAPDADEQQLIAIEREWGAAESKHDEAVFNRILDERFLFVSSSGTVSAGRDAFIEQVRKFAFTSMTYVRDLIEVQGDTATTVGTFTVRRRDGTDSPPSRGVVTYVKKQGQWRALAEHIGGLTPAK